MRDRFDEFRHRLKLANVDEFNIVCSEISEEISKSINDYKAAVQAESEVVSRNVKRSTASLLGTVALTLVSVAAPPVAVVTAPLAAWSVVVGGASVIDVIRAYKGKNKQLALLNERPVGILME